MQEHWTGSSRARAQALTSPGLLAVWSWANPSTSPDVSVLVCTTSHFNEISSGAFALGDLSPILRWRPLHLFHVHPYFETPFNMNLLTEEHWFGGCLETLAAGGCGFPGGWPLPRTCL